MNIGEIVVTGSIVQTTYDFRGKAMLRMSWNAGDREKCLVLLMLGTSDKAKAISFDFRRALNSIGWWSQDQLIATFGQEETERIVGALMKKCYPEEAV